jgi:hypothetical protein
MRAGMGGRIDAVCRAAVLIVTTGRLAEPIVGVTRLPRITAYRGMHAAVIDTISVDAINSTCVLIVTTYLLTGSIGGVTG